MGEEEATMREKLIDAMARAICVNRYGDPDFDYGMQKPRWLDCIPMATTALDAALDMLETPSEEMWGGLARQLIMWMDMGNKTPAGLLKHLERSGRDIPDWLRGEPEMQALNHVPSKGTRAVLVFHAMLATLRSPKI